MYFGIGCSPTETVYAGSYHFVDFKMDLIKYVSEKPAVTGRVAKGQLILTDMIFSIPPRKQSRGVYCLITSPSNLLRIINR